MTSKANKLAPGKPPLADDKIRLPKHIGETDEAALARVAHDPATRAVAVGSRFIAPVIGETNLTESYAALERQITSIKSGDLSEVERKLIAQADTLDAIFYDMARRAASNSGQYLEPMEIYMRLALKAQSQCRATLETLANIKNPPIVFAKQANIAAGPQQVNNGATGPAHAHAEKKYEINSQSHAPCRVDESSAPMLCHEQEIAAPVQRARRKR